MWRFLLRCALFCRSDATFLTSVSSYEGGCGFEDELNKYASNDIPKNSPILRQLLEITERGRSLGIILFSVEQFRSAIHDRVKGNCSTHAYGRTNAIEISKADYKYVPKVYQNMMTRLSPGEYIISNPALRSIVNIRFPRPTYKQFPNG